MSEPAITATRTASVTTTAATIPAAAFTRSRMSAVTCAEDAAALYGVARADGTPSREALFEVRAKHRANEQIAVYAPLSDP
jgi:hypothetical protein